MTAGTSNDRITTSPYNKKNHGLRRDLLLGAGENLD